MNILHYKQFKNGHISVRHDGILKEWSGQIIRRRCGHLPVDKFYISRYFPGYTGKAFIILTPDKGKTFNFVGSGPLKLNGKEL